jgi:hypothetical protein
MPTSARVILVLLLAACGSSASTADPSGPVYEDPRSWADICGTYCQNAAAHGCESALTFGGGTCQESCDFQLTSQGEGCVRAEKNHTACLADVPNVCDAKIRDDNCLDEYCVMRKACSLPDPQCP